MACRSSSGLMSVLKASCHACRPAASSTSRSLSTQACWRPHIARSRPAATPPSCQRRTLWWGASTSSSGASAGLSPFSAGGSGQAAWEALDFVPQVAPDLLPLLLALVLAARREEEEDDSNAQTKLFTVQSVSDKGLGAFATTSIPRGTIVISERALLIWPSQLSIEEAQKYINTLTPSARKAFFSLANIADPSLKLDPIFGIRATNGFNVELPKLSTKLVQATLSASPAPSTASFIFPRIARINHSCAPNADHAMDWSTLKMSVYATTEIASGQEICIEYQAGLVQQTRDERRAALKRDFGFECHCPVCAQSGDALAKSDGRRREINAIVGALGEGNMGSKQAMWETLERLEKLLDLEGYKAMPEFTHQRVSDAFVGFKTIKQQRLAASNQ